MNLSSINVYAKAKKLGEVEKMIYVSTVMHKGWESDNEACLVRMRDGSHKVFSTNHGAVCELKGTELRELIKEATAYLKDISALMQLAEASGAIKKVK